MMEQGAEMEKDGSTSLDMYIDKYIDTTGGLKNMSGPWSDLVQVIFRREN